MYFKYLLIIVFCILGSCKKQPTLYIDNLNNGDVYIIGHGGIGFSSYQRKMPENSMLSIKTALGRYGANGIEVDLQFTKDGEVVLFHDNALETSSNGVGSVYNYNLSELKQFKYNNHYFNNLFLNEKIISLEELFVYLSSLNVKPQLHLDLKHWLFDDKKNDKSEFLNLFISEINELIVQYNYEDYTYVSSTDIESLEIFNEINPYSKLFFETIDVKIGIEIVINNNWYGLLCKRILVNDSDVKYAHQNNVFICIFGVVTKADIYDAIDQNVDFVITDNIPLSVSILR